MKRNKKLEAIQLLYDIHSRQMPSAYDRGLSNGLALAISIITEEPPKYVKNSDFNDMENTYVSAK